MADIPTREVAFKEVIDFCIYRNCTIEELLQNSMYNNISIPFLYHMISVKLKDGDIIGIAKYTYFALKCIYLEEIADEYAYLIPVLDQAQTILSEYHLKVDI